MITDIIDTLRGKKILLLGFGREGRASYELIRRWLPGQPLAIADQRQIDLASLSNVEGIFGEGYQNCLAHYDLILKSPGIVLGNHAPEVLERVTSQSELLLKAFRGQVIGITGTKGKSTTSSLIYHVLKQAYPDCLLMGNIGIPPFSLAEQITEKTLVVCELSCHQLERIRVSPHVAVLLNLFEEHLDHYGSREAYFEAKRNICRYQQPGDWYFCNVLQKDDVAPLAASQVTLCQNGAAELSIQGRTIFRGGRAALELPEGCCPLLGAHNLYNIMVAYGVAKLYGVTDGQFLAAIKTFAPLPHRLQNIGCYGGVAYYDDSISTACETAIQAMESLKTPGVGSLLLGGMDRGIDYQSLCSYLLHNPPPHLILMPDSGKRIAEALRQAGCRSELHLVEDLKEAVAVAKKVTPKGTACLLSPAAASYGFFRDFEERGERFAQYAADPNI